MSHTIKFTAPKANMEGEVTVNEWPEGKGMEFVNASVKIWGADVIADNINTIAEQKLQNSCRAKANPSAKGEPGLSLAAIQEMHKDWKLGVSRPRGTRAVSSEAYMAQLQTKTTEDIMEEIKKLQAMVEAKKAAAKAAK